MREKRHHPDMPVLQIASLSQLYALAAEVFRLAPWQLMDEEDFCGIELTKGGFVFPVVIGTLGESFGLVVYRGIRGFDSMIEIQSGDLHPAENPEMRDQQDAVFLEFVPTRILQPEDRAHWKAAGGACLKSDWGLFMRSLKPGYVPFGPSIKMSWGS